MFDIINTLTEKDVKENFVAVGSYVSKHKNVPDHSVLVIKYNDEIFQFHYDSKCILLDGVYNNDCFHKITDTINPVLIPSFIVWCKKIMKNANPRYGYFYSGEYYDVNGIHFSDKEISETMTCTGFCLNVLKGFLEDDYLQYSDWNTPSYPSVTYLDRYSAHYKLDKNKISESHRRISPIELLCSAYFVDLPIKKSQVDLKLDEVTSYLKNY
ncbi:hypothetical protein [uncultured Dokdonia sp.]|uniref:hypothetical protein n=1 Tax=uncultured Dokdonia sp. TaxID=575653 RepID=UPI002601A7F9|nr:hypothetical protein [uncultured Dokdonia sp.]